MNYILWSLLIVEYPCCDTCTGSSLRTCARPHRILGPSGVVIVIPLLEPTVDFEFETNADIAAPCSWLIHPLNCTVFAFPKTEKKQSCTPLSCRLIDCITPETVCRSFDPKQYPQHKKRLLELISCPRCAHLTRSIVSAHGGRRTLMHDPT